MCFFEIVNLHHRISLVLKNHCILQTYLKHSILFLIVFSINPLIGQDASVDTEVKGNEQFWLDYIFSKAITEKKYISTQIGFIKTSPQV